jgi:hypothetical protein
MPSEVNKALLPGIAPYLPDFKSRIYADFTDYADFLPAAQVRAD